MRLSLLRSGALIGAAVLALIAIFYAISILTYSGADRALNSAAIDAPHNWMGQSGAYVADAALFLFGLPAIFLTPLLLVIARRLWRDVPQPTWKRQLLLCIIGMILIGFGMAHWQHGESASLPGGWGGTLALLLDNGAMALLDRMDGGWRSFARLALILLP
ncbi:MAG: hypothetical protein RL481_451, partial [Pseudomonadota bacterium]